MVIKVVKSEDKKKKGVYKQGAEVKQHSNFPLEDMVDKIQSTALATFLFLSRDGTESSTHYKTLTEKNQHITLSQRTVSLQSPAMIIPSSW